MTREQAVEILTKEAPEDVRPALSFLILYVLECFRRMAEKP